MSAHKHEYLTEERARAILEDVPRIAEMTGLVILAQRRLLPVTTEEERAAARRFTAERQQLLAERRS